MPNLLQIASFFADGVTHNQKESMILEHLVSVASSTYAGT